MILYDNGQWSTRHPDILREGTLVDVGYPVLQNALSVSDFAVQAVGEVVVWSCALCDKLGAVDCRRSVGVLLPRMSVKLSGPVRVWHTVLVGPVNRPSVLGCDHVREDVALARAAFPAARPEEIVRLMEAPLTGELRERAAPSGLTHREPGQDADGRINGRFL